jgi:hypothetical protein
MAPDDEDGPGMRKGGGMPCSACPELRKAAYDGICGHPVAAFRSMALNAYMGVVLLLRPPWTWEAAGSNPAGKLHAGGAGYGTPAEYGGPAGVG